MKSGIKNNKANRILKMKKSAIVNRLMCFIVVMSMILYNEDGTVLFDPSDPDRYEKDIDEISDPGDYGDVDINVPIEIEEKEDEASGSSG